MSLATEGAHRLRKFDAHRLSFSLADMLNTITRLIMLNNTTFARFKELTDVGMFDLSTYL